MSLHLLSLNDAKKLRTFCKISIEFLLGLKPKNSEIEEDNSKHGASILTVIWRQKILAVPLTVFFSVFVRVATSRTAFFKIEYENSKLILIKSKLQNLLYWSVDSIDSFVAFKYNKHTAKIWPSRNWFVLVMTYDDMATKIATKPFVCRR